ncbi:MAG: Inner membrane ABC transporter permease protein YcjP [Spirochaetes bacterium ADurb.Bin315]|jgi:multiple sugar transport system permease protein|nr:MAG: Inner membrane ABC transporter permease protein YcjP [Spirochaetes bacterium ADurb.Bin315]
MSIKKTLHKMGIRALIIWIPVILIVFYSLFPLVWAFITSIKPTEEIHTQRVKYWSNNPTLDNYIRVLGRTDFPRQFLNSMIVSAGTTVFCVALSITASYAFSRFRFRGSTSLKKFFLASQMFPKVLVIIPLFIIMRNLRLLNTRISLILAYASFSLPYVVYMLLGYFMGIAQELDEAATVDGCSRTGILFRIVLPLAIPGIVATAIYAFINAWNELMFAVMFTSTREMRTLPVGLNSYIGEYGIEWGMMCAAGIMTAVPVILLFMFLQKYLIAGMTAGGVKG